MRLRELNDYGLMHAIIDGGKPVVAAFVEHGGHESRAFERAVDGLAGELGNDAVFAVVDVTENPTIAGKYGAPELPCVALFRDGKHLGTSCALGRAELLDFIRSTLKQ